MGIMRVRYELSAGIFLVCALALFILSIWVLGREREIFSRQEPYLAIFSDVKGLTVGAPVRLGGIAVGRVAQVDFSPKLSDTRVHIKLLINERFVERIKVDSLASIETQGLLGDRFVSISSGSENKQLLPGSYLGIAEADDIGELANKASHVVNNIQAISENLKGFSTELSKDTIKSFSETSKHLAGILKEVDKGSGLLHRLIYSKEDGEKILKHLTDASKDISAITRRVRSGDSLLHSLIYDRGGAQTVSNVSLAAEKLAFSAQHVGDLASQVKDGNGLLHGLIYTDSPEGLEQVVEKLNQTADNLRKASEALANGSGTLGALLVDPQLYNNLLEVTDEAKRSFLLREAIKASLK